MSKYINNIKLREQTPENGQNMPAGGVPLPYLISEGHNGILGGAVGVLSHLQIPVGLVAKNYNAGSNPFTVDFNENCENNDILDILDKLYKNTAYQKPLISRITRRKKTPKK